MLSTPTNTPMSSRAAGKARAPDVGIRARISAAQKAHAGAHFARPQRGSSTDDAAATHSTHSRRLSATLLVPHCIDLRPNEIREALNAKQMASLTKPVRKPHVRGRPNEQELHHGNVYVNWVRKGVLARMPHMSQKEVPADQTAEYEATFDVLWAHVYEVDTLLPLYACWMTEDNIRQLIAITTVVKQQKTSMSTNSPRYFVDLEAMMAMIRAIQGVQQSIAEAHRAQQRSAGADPSMPQMGHAA
ncbi:hypothetical protein IEO21_02120 [Rhodonia placenta]|uniref:Uncharacterized protein n=1 Tax=Rhodonia placenta TaxID=104341 RepID=A0A8H7P8E6_9APHY|nr:hypothetical protein IEO21_02120 [Postia placenta]